jgi:hypothetical protein
MPTFMQRAAVVVAATALTVVSATSAQAAVIPRLAGSYSVKSTITADQHNPGAVGTTAITTWKFTPSCTGANGCKTTLVRPRTSGHPKSVTTVLGPVVSGTGTYHYKGSKTYLSACFRDNGSIVDNAYSTQETTNLTVTNTNTSNIVTAFKGTVVLVFTRTASAPTGCTNDRIALGVKSLKRL